MMLSLLPVAFFLITFLVIEKTRAASDWRSSFLWASLVWGLLVTGISEFLSIFRLVGFWEVLGAWIISSAIVLIWLFRINGGLQRPDFRTWLASTPRFQLLLLAGLALIIVIVGAIAVISPPNNWDSMTYHMSRVAHWIQNRSVAHYPTSFTPQLYEGPWAEFAIMHFQILTDSDRLVNLIQWFSLIGSAIGVSLLARQLRAGPRGQIFAAVFCSTIPMGILQGSTTQTDYVVSFWLVCCIYFAFRLKERDQIRYALAAGAAMGLAILTKPTAYVYAFPFMAWISLSILYARRIKAFLPIALIIAVALVINFGQYMRNYSLFGSPLGPGYEEGVDGPKRYANDMFTLPSLTSNVVRNIGLQIGTPFQSVNAFLERGINKVHRMIGLDTNDPRTTWPRTKFYVERSSLQEDRAGSPLHLILISIIMLELFGQRNKNPEAIFFSLCLILGFLLFCLYLKWQPSHSRLHLPLFVLGASLVGLFLSQIKVHWIAGLSMVILFVGATPYVLYNQARPLLGPESILPDERTELYFRNRPYLTESYTQATQFLSATECSDIGLILPLDSYEYPFWVLLGQDRIVRMQHVHVTNISGELSREYPFNTFTPCAVIVVSEEPVAEVSVEGLTYQQRWSSDYVSILIQE
ncbi:MAG: glycosyltransferase family 39 protein [Chloroflexota bacterium]